MAILFDLTRTKRKGSKAETFKDKKNKHQNEVFVELIITDEFIHKISKKLKISKRIAKFEF